MRAVILAAGRGSRMQNETDDMPKCLVELGGKPLIEWQIMALKDAGISDISVVTGYRGEMLAQYELVNFHNSRWYETNMVSSLLCARDWMVSESTIISYSDIFYRSEAVQSIMNTPNEIAISYDPNWLELWKSRFQNPLDDAETFMVDDAGNLIEIGNRALTTTQIQGQYMGLLKFTAMGWGVVDNFLSKLTQFEVDNLQMTHLLQEILNSRLMPISAVPYEGIWGEIDSKLDLEIYRKNFISKDSLLIKNFREE
jgi:choline kinase